MTPGAPSDASRRFLAEAHARGLLTVPQRDDCARILAAFGEIGVEMAPDEVAVRKGFLSQTSKAAVQVGKIYGCL